MLRNGLADRLLFCFWTGREKLSKNRKRALLTLQEYSGVNVTLITQKNLDEWILPEAPLHFSYQHLSSTHKSDYLRSYFMYHYGGGYSDIKPLKFDWNDAFRRLDAGKIQFVGSPERYPWHVAGTSEMQSNYRNFASNGAFVFRPYSDFALEWRRRVHEVLDSKLEMILKFPGTYHPRAVRQGIHGARFKPWQLIPRGYPLEWNEIMGRVFHQLQWESPGNYSLDLPPLDYGEYR